VTMLEKRSRDLLPIVLAIAIFAALSIWEAIKSTAFLEADSCTHYLYARFALQQPVLLVNVWGRPICTALYMIPAAIWGRIGVRFTSLLIAISCGLVAYRIARNQNYRWPALALIFTLAQPLVFLHSFSELTELPFALMIGLAFWAYQKRLWLAMTILISLTPLARPEGFGFLLLAALALIAHRRGWWLLILPIPLIYWNQAGWILYGKSGPWWKWLADNWPYAAESLYQRGSIFHFVMLMPAVISPIIFPALLMGTWRSLLPLPSGEGRGEGVLENPTATDSPNALTPILSRSEREVNQKLIAIIPLLILVGHSFLYALGKMASNGELRYMLVVAPFWGLLAAYGWEWIFVRLNWRAPLRIAGAVAMAPVLINCFYYKVLPLKSGDDWDRVDEIAQWYQTSDVRKTYPYICAAHPAMFYYLDISMIGPSAREWNATTIAHPQPGTLLVWDSMYGISNADARRSIDKQKLLDTGWIIVDLPPTARATWCIGLSPQDISGNPTPVNLQLTLPALHN
jgi:hypothetical protein